MWCVLQLLILTLCIFANKLKTDPLHNVWGQNMWYSNTVSIDDIPELDKPTWLEKYMKFFSVPKWLAEEEFENCDSDKSGKIGGTELRCY